MTDKTLNYEPLHEFAARNRVSYNELCVAVRAALAAQPEEPVAWMPIESSPKDGTWMYVWRKHGTFPIQAKYSIKYAWFEDDDANHLYNLTHWMPLPAAPGAAQSDPVPPPTLATCSPPLQSGGVMPDAIEPGDHVHHHPTGEDWVVRYVKGDRLSWLGWPPGEAMLADCTLIRKADDEARPTRLIRAADGEISHHKD